MTPVTRGRNDLWGGLVVAIGIVLAVTAFAGVSLFQIGAAAFFSWLALTRRQGWAWIPAAIFGFNVAKDLLDGVGGSLFFPLMVVAAGVLMLSRDRLSKNTTIGILLLLAVIGVASSNRYGEIDLPNPGSPLPPAAPAPRAAPAAELEVPDDAQALPDLDGRELVVLAEDIDVELRQARRGPGMVSAEGVSISDESSEVLLIDATSAPDAVEIEVPAEASVRVRTTFGDVKSEVGSFALDVDTVSGDVKVDLTGAHAVTAETSDGTITAEGIEDLDPEPRLLATEITGPRVRIKTVAGAISISQD